MPNPSSGGRDSRRSSKSGPSSQEAYRNSERREKAKSTQSYTGTAYGAAAARRGSVQPNADGSASLSSVPERPRLKARTHSAPLVETHPAVRDGGDSPQQATEAEDRDYAVAQATLNALIDGQDEDEVAGAVGTVRQYQPFQSPEVSEPLTEINIAVIGAGGVGKSTFLQRALDLPALPPSNAVERKIPLDGSEYLVRLLELPIDEVEVDNDDDTVGWPETIEDRRMPRIHGAIAMYDVQDRDSFRDIPDILNAINRAELPSVLVSSKCDTPAGKRELDPAFIERKARASISGISTLQTSEESQESNKRAISMILKAIVLGIPGSSSIVSFNSSANRRRAQSNAVRPVSPRPPTSRGHARASSEYSGSLYRDAKHSRHDSSLAGYGSNSHLQVPSGITEEDSPRSFYVEESASEGSPESARSSVSAEVAQQTLGGAPSVATISENGATFDELVDRLLAQPTSKVDSRFASIFLALYRKFAAPGRLLEAIADRFDALERNGNALMIKTVIQLRYLERMEQWIGQYPGDFAHPRTKRRMQTFIAKVSGSRISAVATNELTNHMAMVTEDDDTNWAYSDKDRETDYTVSNGSTSSTLIDDPAMIPDGAFSGTTLADDNSTTATTGGDTVRSGSGSSITSSQIMASVEAAQKAAKLLQPLPRKAVTKEEWHALMELPDGAIAKELTRMDWVMFSAIRPRDLVRHVSAAEKARCKNLVNVNRMIGHFNQIASWVANYILLRDKPKHRALMLEKFMRIARKLRELNNYNSLGAIIAGIKSSAIGRLNATRELLPQDVGKDWLKLEILMSSSRSHAAYRLAWENSNSERIPYIPLHLRDLASAEQGNSNFIGDDQNGKINWKKFEIMGDVVVSMQRAQGMPYRGLGGAKGEALIKELVLDVKLEKDEDALFARSHQVEPTAGTGGTSEKLKQFFKR
ncbi:hypothetical protein BAUCODRAFT_578020 [Baudoinia panamericana UAMH 10762]|uniref:Ras-GEF domain-containing protein n=1 Tax=Baudoinia panamericana (strain UAMH 10762) TaxID=717646 RepID=M2MUT3_BAUPA|nr:uncharacterized protein BAUCODRAFT_578020 [Baudoinia panamericana UAMH 10762]EMC95338.1 hypothetical protein BAUCODRAFT_578020 [Baudoinia panamericana UAMH 10762]